MKLAVFSSHTPSLFWFRFDMMKEFINYGCEVIALGNENSNDWDERFNEYNIKYRQIYVERNSINPKKDIKTFREIYKFIKNEKPDKIFTYQAKTIIYGSIAAKLNGITEVYPMITGLGSIFRGTGIRNKIVKMIMSFEYRIALKCSKKVFFHNADDQCDFINHRLIKADKAIILNGSGVNIEKFNCTDIPEQAAFLFIGRLIKDKGIIEYLEACKRIKLRYPSTRCLLVGPYDSNPSALSEKELEPFISSGTIEYFGEQKDVRPFITQCSTYIFPSYFEGIPKTVLEAMSMGRAIITSDSPGCRETVVDGVNGYLLPIKNIGAIVEKMEYLILNPEINREMGYESRMIAIEKYNVEKVNREILNAMGFI